MKQVIKRWKAALLCGLIFSILVSMTAFEGSCQAIRSSVLRLHVLANSDLNEDQQLKIKVRDRLISEGALLLSGSQNEQEAALAARKHMDEIRQAAQDEVYRWGYAYPVTVEVARCWFETRVYDAITLPAGHYEAVRVLIGEGKGENWWCVMFPPMCLPAAQGEGELERVLDDGEMQVVQNGKKYEYKFKTVEWYEKLKRRFQ